jgi:hypothetical protein
MMKIFLIIRCGIIGSLFQFAVYSRTIHSPCLDVQISIAGFSLNDVNRDIRLLNAAGQKRDEVHFGKGCQISYYHPLKGHWNLDIGLGMYRADSGDKLHIPHTLEIAESPETLDLDHQIQCSDYHLKAGLSYMLQIQSISVSLIGAGTLHHASLHESGLTEPVSIGNRKKMYRFDRQASSSGMGFEFSLNTEWNVKHYWGFTADIGYRLTHIAHFNSDWISEHYNLDFSGLFLRAGFRFHLH